MITAENLGLRVRQINSLIQQVREYKTAHPETKVGYYRRNVGSLLNAYREGDLSFDDCVRTIEAMIGKPGDEGIASDGDN